MKSKSNKVTEIFTFKRIAIPVIVGILIASYLLIENTNWDEFQKIEWGFNFFFWIFISLIMMAIRDFAYMYRIRTLTGGKMSWKNSFSVIMLWEFASAVTPSVVGGTGVAVFILTKEGINAGKSAAIALTTAFLDELFYIITVPIIIFIVGTSSLFPSGLTERLIFGMHLPIKSIFLLGYGFIILLASIVGYGIFINPKKFKSVIVATCKLKLLNRLQQKAEQFGDDIIQTSKELKKQPFSYWFKAFGATFFSWTARFWMVNCIILAFTSVNDHFLIYARQLIMWVILLISPTPGGTGVAEFAFNEFLSDFTPFGLAGLLAVLWRLLSYYPYLFIGSFALPRWLKRVYG